MGTRLVPLRSLHGAFASAPDLPDSGWPCRPGHAHSQNFATAPEPSEAIRPERETRLNSKRGWPLARCVGPVNGGHSLTPGHTLTRDLPYINYPLSVKRYFAPAMGRHGPSGGCSTVNRNIGKGSRKPPVLPGLRDLETADREPPERVFFLQHPRQADPEREHTGSRQHPWAAPGQHIRTAPTHIGYPLYLRTDKETLDAQSTPYCPSVVHPLQAQHSSRLPVCYKYRQ